MLKSLSAAAASMVAIVFVIVSIAHACSGSAPMSLALHQSPMSMGEGNDSPCGKEKGNICQSVRDSMMSVKSSSVSAADNAQQTVPPLQPSVEGVALVLSSPATPVIAVSFHPVFKLPLT